MMEDVMAIISMLDDTDKQKLSEFAQMLVRRKKYEQLRKEIDTRRSEIKKGETLSHDAIWANR
jgi:hypothetical protein